jgi:adenosylmethionine-8-amino-7-oxononanoate aminotransferase
VLLRPLGDVVVVLPPLTTTLDEIERVVEVLAASVDQVWAEDAGAEGTDGP